MGITKLSDLAKTGDRSLAVAAAVLRAELSEGRWTSEDEFLESYPQAVLGDFGARVFLDADHAVDLRYNFATGMLLIDSAGPTARPFPAYHPGVKP